MKLPLYFIVKKWYNDDEVEYLEGPFNSTSTANEIMCQNPNYDDSSEYYEILIVKSITDVDF